MKQEVESVTGDLVVSGLDSVTSLIQNAKNLLAAVLETVRLFDDAHFDSTFLLLRVGQDGYIHKTTIVPQNETFAINQNSPLSISLADEI